MASNSNGHLTLGLKIIGLFAAILFVLTSGLVAFQKGEVADLAKIQQEATRELAEAYGGTMNEHDIRIRQVEQSNAAVQERLDGIQRSLDRIERRIETKGAPR